MLLLPVPLHLLPFQVADTCTHLHSCAGRLKSSDYLLLAGPYGKCILEVCLHPEQQTAVFEYLDLIGSLWRKTITDEELDHLETALPKILAELEWLLPSWELDINRHMMLHLVASIRHNGPVWSWSMFGFERMWYRLLGWMTQKSHPEATMLNAFRAFTQACIALPDQMAALPATLTEPSQSFGLSQTPFYHVPRMFDPDTFALELPFFLQNHQGPDIEFYDFKGAVMLLTDSKAKGDKAKWLAELHLFYINFPELCRACLCSAPCSCQDYYAL